MSNEKEPDNNVSNPDTTPQPEMDLDTARAIVQMVVDTDENSFTELSDFNKIGDYTIEQVKEAETQVAKHIFATSFIEAAKTRGDGSLMTRKQIGEATLRLHLQASQIRRQHLLSLELVTPQQERARNLFLRNSLLLGKGQNLGESVDGRRTPRLINGIEGIGINDFRELWRGLRWMSFHLLNWDNPNVDTILPEQVIRHS